MQTARHQFASDNYAGIAPEAWQAMEEANRGGHVRAYGDDAWTQAASDLVRETFETDCQVFFVFNGTAANSLALASLCQSYHSVLCHETAHVETDECGAPEFFSNGTKILQLPGENGKIVAGSISQAARRRTDIHYPKPRVVSLTQATELGTVYTPSEMVALVEEARSEGLRVHVDGARFANAVASLDLPPKALTWELGVDVMSLGATKSGSCVGDAVVFFNQDFAEEFEYRCKQSGQLASKMRFLSAPFVGLLRDGAWLRHARNANTMAARLEQGILRLARDDIRLLVPRQVNSVFVQLPQPVIDDLHSRGWHFYTFIAGGGCRLMCSWDTTAEHVDEFLSDLGSLIGQPAK
jgi:threonine aldolase